MPVLPIKKEWFNMILLGEKTEEYREMKPYYQTRFCNWFGIIVGKDGRIVRPCHGSQPVVFRNGYHRNAPFLVAMCTVEVGEGREEWGAEKGKRQFILKIHKIIKEGVAGNGQYY